MLGNTTSKHIRKDGDIDIDRDQRERERERQKSKCPKEFLSLYLRRIAHFPCF
jgi:hypothetical protein